VGNLGKSPLISRQVVDDSVVTPSVVSEVGVSELQLGLLGIVVTQMDWVRREARD